MVSHGSYSDGSTFEITDLVSWSSEDPSIVEAGGSGIIARGEGFTEIVGTCAGIQRRLPLEVRAGELRTIAITPNPASVVRGSTANLTATGTDADGTTYDLTWFAGWGTVDPSVAWISSSMGSPAKLWGVNAGTTGVSAAWAGVGGSSVVNVTSMASVSPRP